MRARTSFFTTFVAAVVAVAAIGAAGHPALAAKHHQPAPPIVVDENDYDATIQVTVGQDIEIMLQYPGYGQYGRYGWRLSDISGRAVKSRGHGPAGSAGGAVCYRLRAVKEGSATCTCVFEPPPWLMMPARQLEVTFEVQP